MNRKKFGLLGYPLSHSFSPAMHNAALRRFGIDAQYFLFEKRNKDEVNAFLKNLNKQEITGLNVTVPYKEVVLKYLDRVSEDAAKIGAVNTIVSRQGFLEGCNTDWFGFSKDINKLISLSGAKVALLGAGGAAKAVSYALVKERVAELAIFDIDSDRSAKLIQKVKSWAEEKRYYIELKKAENIKELEIAEKDLLVNATPLGLYEKDPPLVEKDSLHKGLVVYDLIYNPSLTKLLVAAKERNLKFANGLGMLIYQGAKSFLHFTQSDFELEKVAAAMQEALEEK